MPARWLRRSLLAAGCVTAVLLGLTWWFFHATPEQHRRMFNFIYSHPMGAFTREPNRLLVDTIASLPPGRALDIAMGEGRNAVYLASKGWDVTGFDISDEALRQAAAHAAAAGIHIRALQASSETFDYGHEQWDLILLSYAFAPIRDAAYIRRLRDAMKPGGVVVFEHYIQASGFRDIPGAPYRGQLPRLFAGFEIRRHEEMETQGDWLFGRKAPLARLVAVKPA